MKNPLVWLVLAGLGVLAWMSWKASKRAPAAPQGAPLLSAADPASGWTWPPGVTGFGAAAPPLLTPNV